MQCAAKLHLQHKDGRIRRRLIQETNINGKKYLEFSFPKLPIKNHYLAKNSIVILKYFFINSNLFIIYIYYFYILYSIIFQYLIIFILCI